MGVAKQTDIKNRTYYFYNDIIDLKHFDARLLKIDKNITKALISTTLDTSQLKKFDDCKNIYSVYHLYLLTDHAGRYIEEKKWK